MASSNALTVGTQAAAQSQSDHLTTTDAAPLPQDQSAAPQPALQPPAEAATTTCRFWLSGHCYRDNACWFRHQLGDGERRVTLAELRGEASTSQDPPLGVGATAVTSTPDHAEAAETVRAALAPLPEPPCCDICYEIPATYGLLEKCSHVFCLTCIRQWRAPGGDTRVDLQESGVTKACPACRTRSLFIIPSSTHHAEGETKNQIIQRYKDVLSRKPCKHFEQTKNSSRGPTCPFGDECHYKHQLTEGDTRYTFGRGYQPFRETESRRRIDRILRRLPDHPSLRVQMDRLTRILMDERTRAVWEDAAQTALEEVSPAVPLGTSRDEWVQNYRRAQEEGQPVPISQREAELQQQWGNAWDQLDAAEEASPAEAATGATDARGTTSTSRTNATASNSDQPETSAPTRSSASPEGVRTTARSQRRRAQRRYLRDRHRNAESAPANSSNGNSSNGTTASQDTAATTTDNTGNGGNPSANVSSDAPHSTPASRRAAFEQQLAATGDDPLAPDFPAEMYDMDGHLIEDEDWCTEVDEDLEDEGYTLYGTGGHRGPHFFDEDGLEIETYGMVDWSDEEDGVWYQV